MSIRPNRLWPAILLTAGTVALTACGSSGSTASSGSTTASAAASGSASGSASGTAEPGHVTVKVTEADGCIATPNTVPAGQVTFVVTNVDAVGVTEVELVADQRIVGERENLAPGFDSTFSARLDGGTFEIYCPGASTERTTFTVTGEAAARRMRT